MHTVERLQEVISIGRPPTPYIVAKRSIDLVCAVVLLLVLLPVLLACALAIRLDSPGPVLFRQQRVGERGRRFTILKFRSMRANASTAAHQEFAAKFVKGQPV